MIKEWCGKVTKNELPEIKKLEPTGNPLDKASDWKKISFPNNLKRIFPNDDFQGVIILKKSFEISDFSSNYVFKIDEASLGWAGEMREYDIYINGIKIWSTFKVVLIPIYFRGFIKTCR